MKRIDPLLPESIFSSVLEKKLFATTIISSLNFDTQVAYIAFGFPFTSNRACHYRGAFMKTVDYYDFEIVS